MEKKQLMEMRIKLTPQVTRITKIKALLKKTVQIVKLEQIPQRKRKTMMLITMMIISILWRIGIIVLSGAIIQNSRLCKRPHQCAFQQRNRTR